MSKQKARADLAAATAGVPVTKVKRGKRSKKIGRKRLDGERHPCGKLKPKAPLIAPLAPAVIDRIRRESEAGVADKLFGTEVGRLYLHGELTATHVAAAKRIAEIKAAFDRLHGKRRSPASPSYERGSFGRRDQDEDTAEQEDRDERAQLADDRLEAQLKLFPEHITKALMRLCVADKPIGPIWIVPARAVLDHFAQLWGVVSAKKQPTRTNRTGWRILRRPGETPATAAQPRVDLDLKAWMTVLRRVMPKAADADLEQMVHIARAVKAREQFRRAKEGRGL